MIQVSRHRAFGAATGWWATAARALALVLALAVSAPVACLADDIAFHAGRHGGPAAMSADDASSTEAADPGLAGHVHCDCHRAAGLDHGAEIPAPGPSRPIFARTSDVPTSVPADRLPRPPRA